MMRLSKITTRTGDDGSTSLANGSRLYKDHARIATLGSIDELNSHIGLLLTEIFLEDIREVLLAVQNDLFDLGGALASFSATFPPNKLKRLDIAIAHYNAGLSPLKEFILPGGTRTAALCHIARSVARRAERDLVSLSHIESLPANGLPYLNRLSDLLFILSRRFNQSGGETESYWRRKEQ
jgi:cob(I)alamin adenosyltransferase